MQDDDCSMHIKKCSYRTKLLNAGCGVWTTPTAVNRRPYITCTASPHRRSRAGARDTRDGTFANPGIPLNLAHRKAGIAQSNNNGIALPPAGAVLTTLSGTPRLFAILSAKAWRFPLCLFHIAQRRFAAVGRRKRIGNKALGRTKKLKHARRIRKSPRDIGRVTVVSAQMLGKLLQG